MCSNVFEPDILASIAIAIINGMMRRGERRILKGKGEGKRGKKPETAKEADEDKPMRELPFSPSHHTIDNGYCYGSQNIWLYMMLHICILKYIFDYTSGILFFLFNLNKVSRQH